ncbi:two-component system chemotaxis sensor kinase CheA [Evansella vedderi]|uniref:Chemotaxis protein CheA n=1 Tax=Evansella vedderi TaxID=38282 RepID=A0ABT9ZSF6_9BACI|nr:chemotaxis protein CheA [Evansella vedderi]MDQ0253692.1 two-component system chemotaxis sensor kinase CheA [Evansella vedderi]
MDKSQYLDMFIDESKEHLQAINDNLLLLEKNPSEENIINEIFRSAHTLKGMSATMGFSDLANLTHQMENVLDGIRNEIIMASSELIDMVFESVDYLEAMIQDIADGGNGQKNVTEIVKKLEMLEKGSFEETSTTIEIINQMEITDYDDFEQTVLSQSREQGFNAYYVSISLREDCILKAARVYMVFEVLEQIGEVIKSVPSVEELEEESFDFDFSVTLITKEAESDVKGKVLKVSEIESVSIQELTMEKGKRSSKESNQPQKSVTTEEDVNPSLPVEEKGDTTTSSQIKNGTSSKTIRVNIERLDSLMNLFEELVIDRGRLEQISSELKDNDLTETVEHMSRISSDLQSIILTMRMVPVDHVFNRFPRMVRGLAKELNKMVDLEIVGASTELDRTVIDEIGDPLVHLLRNSIDHGIESCDIRKREGKSEIGKITLKAYHSGNHVFIEVSDDGAGINRQKVMDKAINNGIIHRETAATLTDQEVDELLFSSGFSTAEEISDISGRGVGLDVVKNKIESLGGSVSVFSNPGEGTTFSIQLPLTLSIISAMLVEVQDEIYALPLSSIIETAIIKEEDILSAHNQKVIDFRGSVVPVIDLTEFFQVPVSKEQSEYYSVVVVRKSDKMAALVVNSFIGQQEIVLKSLGNYLTSTFAISGATILGNGEVALIIDCNAFIK